MGVQPLTLTVDSNQMKSARLALGILALLPFLCIGPSAFSQAPIVGPGQFIMCPKSVQASIVTATTTQLVAPVTGQSVFVCGWHVTSTQSTSTTFQIIFGAGATCGTNTITLTPAFSVTSTAPSGDHQTYAIGPNSTVSQGLCVVTVGATIGQAVMIYYSQF